MKKHFMTGVAILLPLAITFMIVHFVVNVVTRPFVGFIMEILKPYDIFHRPFLLFSANQVLNYSSQIIVILALLFATILLGVLARLVLFGYFFRIADFLFHRIPFVNKIYKATQDVVHTLFQSEGRNFSQVVLVPFPHAKTLTLGLITNNSSNENKKAETDLISVFIPATPNPTMGFLLLFPRKQLTFLDMRVEDALKCIVSCGIMFSELTLSKSSKKHSQETL